MPKQYLIPGRGYINDGESGVQRLFAGIAYLTDAATPPVVGRLAATLGDAGRPSTATQTARQFFMRGNGYANDLGLGQTRMFGLMGVLVETPAPVAFITGTLAVTLADAVFLGGIQTYTGTLAVTLDDAVFAGTGSILIGGTLTATLNGVYSFALGGESAAVRSGMVALSSSIRSMGEQI